MCVCVCVCVCAPHVWDYDDVGNLVSGALGEVRKHKTDGKQRENRQVRQLQWGVGVQWAIIEGTPCCRVGRGVG